MFTSFALQAIRSDKAHCLLGWIYGPYQRWQPTSFLGVESSRAGSWIGSAGLVKIEPSRGSACHTKMSRNGARGSARLACSSAREAHEPTARGYRMRAQHCLSPRFPSTPTPARSPGLAGRVSTGAAIDTGHRHRRRPRKPPSPPPMAPYPFSSWTRSIPRFLSTVLKRRRRRAQYPQPLPPKVNS